MDFYLKEIIKTTFDEMTIQICNEMSEFMALNGRDKGYMYHNDLDSVLTYRVLPLNNPRKSKCSLGTASLQFTLRNMRLYKKISI